MRNSELMGCIPAAIWFFMIYMVSWVGNLLLGYNLDVWLGYEQWYEVNFFLRLLLGIISISAATPFAVVGFLLALVFGAPILM